MSEPIPLPRRVLLTMDDRKRQTFRDLFAAPELAGWEAAEADSIARAHFALQTQTCDVVLVDGGLVRPDSGEGLAWLAQHSEAPLLLVAEDAPSVLEDALRGAALGWLPSELALGHPAILDALLRQLARVGDSRRRTTALVAELAAASRRIDHLAEMLWEAAPGQGPTRWFAQRYMLERLEEELARMSRQGGPLSVVLGEVQPAGDTQPDPLEQERLTRWAASQIGQSKRRCDVAGQYGLRGFMLLLPRAGAGEAEGACRRLRGVLEGSSQGTGPRAPLHAYLGAVTASADVTTVAGMLRRAEEQLDQAKGSAHA